MTKLLNIILWIWQLPQNVIGWILSLTSSYQSTTYCNDKKIKVYFSKNVCGCGVSLGNYIILDYNKYCGKSNITTKLHEYGHHIQSLYLGPLYLFVVGIPSVIRNILYRFFNFKKDYYAGFPEKWADELGGVKRV